MFLLRSSIANVRGVGIYGRGSSSSGWSSPSTRSLPSLSSFRDDGDDDVCYDAHVDAADAELLSRRPAAFSAAISRLTSSGAIIVACLSGDLSYAATHTKTTVPVKSPSSSSSSSFFERWIDADRRGRGVEREDDATVFASAARTTTTMVVESPSADEEGGGGSSSPLSDLSVWLISTLKRRKKMMNKHKLRKRRKKLRLKTRK
jgi:hypothetical protein